MKELRLNEMELIIASDNGGCIYRGAAAPFMVLFSGFIPSDYLDSWWTTTADNCF